MKPRSAAIFLVIMASLIGILFCGLRTTMLFEKLEWRLFDQWSRITAPYRPFDPDIVVIAIDEESMNHFSLEQGWRWPWPREAYAHLLLALQSAGAAEVRFDLLFSEASENAMNDDRLTAMSEAMGNVKFGALQHYPSIFKPTFSVDLIQGNDHVVRRDPSNNGLLVWPGSFESVMNHRVYSAWRYIKMGKKIEEQYLSKIDRFDPLAIRKTLPLIPPDPDLEKFLKNRVVFIGGTASKTNDLVSTPVKPNQPGVFAHVVAFSNQKTKSQLQEVPLGFQLFPIFLFCSLWGVYFQRFTSLTAQTFSGLTITLLPLIISLSAFIIGWWIPVLTLSLALFSTSVFLIGHNYIKEGRQKLQIKRIFGDFVSPDIIEELMLDPDNVKLGGVKKNLTVMFSDLAGFSDFSEKISADTLVEIMNFYLTEMSEFVINEKGYLDKYIGDAIMAVFGAPLSSNDHATSACRVAIYSRDHLVKINPQVKERWGFEIFARYGINTGDMVIGQMGSPRKRNYTVIGDAVNLASRLEGANKPYGTTIMISESTLLATGTEFLARPTDLLRVKGKQQAVPVYDLMNFSNEASETEKKVASSTRSGFDAYLQKAWDEAERHYRDVLQVHPGDSLAELYIERIQEFRTNPPATDWDGVYVMKTK